MLRKKVYFNKKFLYIKSMCDQAVFDSETLYIFDIFSTLNKVLII